MDTLSDSREALPARRSRRRRRTALLRFDPALRHILGAVDADPARLQLDPSPAKAVGTAVDVLSRWIDGEHLRLGGGTVLEARWHHRSSSDLDFFTLAEHADIVFYERFEQIAKDLTELASAGTVADRDIQLERFAAPSGNLVQVCR